MVPPLIRARWLWVQDFTRNANITTNKKSNIIMEVIEVIDIFLLLGSSSNGTFSYKNGWRVR